MARIPGAEGFGDAVARPRRNNETQVPGAAFGAPVAAALEGIGNDMARRDAMAQAERDQEARRQALEAEQARKAADRAQAVAVLQRTGDDVATLADEMQAEVLAGKVDKRTAAEEWERRAWERVGTALEEVPQDHLHATSQGLTHTIRTLGRRTIAPAVLKKDQHDTRAGLDAIFESAGRLYRTDAARAEQQVDQAIADLGPHTGLLPDQLQKARQGWIEGTQYTAGFEAITAGRHSMEGLAAAQKMIETGLPAIDPQKRATLLRTIDSDRAQLEAEALRKAQRRALSAEVADRRARAVLTGIETLAEKGGALDPQWLSERLKKLEGTEYHAVAVQLSQQAAAGNSVSVQPIQAQVATLQALDAEIAAKGNTPERQARRDRMERILKSSQADAGRNTLTAWQERSREVAPPIDLSSPQALAATLAQRGEVAARAQAWSGGPMHVALEHELPQIKQMLDVLPVAERSKAIATVASALGPQASAGLARQLEKGDDALWLAFGFAGSQTPEGRLTSELILRGQAAKKDGTSTKGESKPDVKVGEWSARFAKQLDGVFPTPALTKGTLDAALLIAHGIAAENGGRLRERDMDRALHLAVGGTLLPARGPSMPGANGREARAALVVPQGMDEDALDKRLRSVRPAEIGRQAVVPTADGQPQDLSKARVLAAGTPLSVEEFLKVLPGQELEYAGPGRVSVIMGGRPVVNAAGRRIIIELGK